MMSPLNPEVVLQIETLAASFMNSFNSEMGKCNNEFEYFNLLIGAIVFKNMVTHHFEHLLKEDGDENSGEVLSRMHHAADLITQEILARVSTNSQNLN